MTGPERDSVSADVASLRGGTLLAIAGTLLIASELVWLTHLLGEGDRGWWGQTD